MDLEPPGVPSVQAGEADNYTIQSAYLSANGRYVTFDSNLPDLVSGDTNGTYDVFTFDRLTGRMDRDSVSSSGAQATIDPVQNAATRNDARMPSGSHASSITPDGRYVVFSSDASNLAPTAADGSVKAYVHDRVTGSTQLVSQPPPGMTVEWAIPEPGRTISADGRYVVFDGCIPENSIVDYQTNQQCAGVVFLRDRSTGTTTDIDGPPNVGFGVTITEDGSRVAFVRGGQAQPDSVVVWDRRSGRKTVLAGAVPGGSTAAISGDGRYLVFDSLATTLVPNDTNAHSDVFVYDLVTGATVRASVSSQGAQGDNDSSIPTISADGSLIGFSSTASNLTPKSNNGVSHVYLHENELVQ